MAGDGELNVLEIQLSLLNETNSGSPATREKLPVLDPVLISQQADQLSYSLRKLIPIAPLMWLKLQFVYDRHVGSRHGECHISLGFSYQVQPFG